jgi:hypothetical protein
MFNFPVAQATGTGAVVAPAEQQRKFSVALGGSAGQTRGGAEQINLVDPAGVTTGSHLPASGTVAEPQLDYRVLDEFQGYVQRLDANTGQLKFWKGSVEFVRIFDRSYLSQNKITKIGQAVELRSVLSRGNPRLVLRPIKRCQKQAKFTLSEIGRDEFKKLNEQS